MQDRTYVPLRAGRYLHGVVTCGEAKGARDEANVTGHCKDVLRAKHTDGSPHGPPSQEGVFEGKHMVLSYLLGWSS